MKKKIFSIALAVMMCFSLTVSVAAYNGVADIEVIDDYELITPSNIPLSCALFGHSWASPHHTVSIPVSNPNFCYYIRVLETSVCNRSGCNTYKSEEKIVSRRHLLESVGGGLFKCSYNDCYWK